MAEISTFFNSHRCLRHAVHERQFSQSNSVGHLRPRAQGADLGHRSLHRQHKEKQSPLLRPSEVNAKFISCDNFSLLAKLGSKNRESPCKSSYPPLPANKAEKAVEAVSERGFSPKTGNLHVGKK